MLIFFWFMQPTGATSRWTEEVPTWVRLSNEAIQLDSDYKIEWHNFMPGDWKPFAATSPWNTPIGGSPTIHPNSSNILTYMVTAVVDGGPIASRVRFSTRYNPPLWVVRSSDVMNCRYFTAVSGDDGYHESVDVNQDRISDVYVPIAPPTDMWPENTDDGHIIVYIQEDEAIYEASRYEWDYNLPQGSYGPRSTTFAEWKNASDGYGVLPSTAPLTWTSQGSRGSGCPIIGGLLRPEELEYCLATTTEIEHALSFGFDYTYKPTSGRTPQTFQFPPAVRADGNTTDANAPIEGMLFQLDPTLTDGDFDTWGLNAAAKVVARCLQTYGMYLVDRAGAKDGWPMYTQLLSPDNTTHQNLWKARFPNIFNEIKNIRTTDDGTPTGNPTFRVVVPSGQTTVTYPS